MEIRFLNTNDDPLEISNIYEQSWKYAYKNIIPQDYLDSIPSGRWANGVNKNGRKDLAVFENGSLAGTASICASRWEKHREFGEIVSIYLLPEYMGKGIGRILLQRCIKELQKLGYDKILLWVLEENYRARRFYEKNGFVCSGEYMSDNIGGKDLREVMYIYTNKSRNN